VLDPADVGRVRDAGGRLVVMPHGDAAVIARAVVPKETLLLPVGGINPDNMAPYAGADGFGLGSALFLAGATPATVRDNARRFAVARELIRARQAA